MSWLLGILLFYSVVIPYGLSLIYDKDYHSKAIYIPDTKEIIYLITYKSRFDPDEERLRISTSDWRIFHDRERQYILPEANELGGGEVPLYYKVSNDTLYLSMRYQVENPKYWDTKTKIVQNRDAYITTDGIERYWYIDFSSKKECKKWEDLGYTRFP